MNDRERMSTIPGIPGAGCATTLTLSVRATMRFLRVTVIAASIAIPGTGAGGPVASAQQLKIDSTGVRVVTFDPLGADARCSLGEEPTFYVGDDQGREETWFSRVLGVARLSDGSVAVADDWSSEVRIFDAAGRHIRSMGREGEGPGEFDHLWFMWRLPGDTLWVGDYRPWRYHLYSMTGEHIRTVTMDPFYANPSRGGGVLANRVSINVRLESSRRRDFRTPDAWHVEAHGPDGKLMGTLMTLPGRTFGPGSGGIFESPWFDASSSIDARGRTVAIANGLDPEVRVLDEDLRLRLIIRWDAPGREVTAAHIRSAREAARRQATEAGVSSLDRALLNSDRPAADVFPAVSSVVAGVDGTVWVWRYPWPAGVPGQSGAMAFGSDGDFVCYLPPTKKNYTVYEYGADYVLGVQEDELGVQHVAMFDLLRPAGPPR